MKNIILFIIPFLFGCGSVDDTVSTGYSDLCKRQPQSMSCIKHEDTGIEPTYQFIERISSEMMGNFRYIEDIDKYGVKEYWFDNVTTNAMLEGDCDDISLTFISQLIMDGVKPSNIRLVASGIDGELKHYYVKVKLSYGMDFDFYKIDKYTDIMYMQYDNTGVFINDTTATYIQ